MPCAYRERDKLLIKLGYTNYPEYLNSALWSGIRERVYVKYGKVCKVCKGLAVCVHHLSYDEKVLLGEKLKYLVPLCDDCHLEIEFDGERKRTFQGALWKYRCLIGECGEKSPESSKPPRTKPLSLCWTCGKQGQRHVNYCRKCEPPKVVSNVANRCETCGKVIKQNRKFCKPCRPEPCQGKYRIPTTQW